LLLASLANHGIGNAEAHLTVTETDHHSSHYRPLREELPKYLKP
jgi:hypothetical protein